MKTINIYGCSFTHGVAGVDDHRSWPQYFYDLVKDKDIQIRNWSFQGCDIVSQFNFFMQQKKPSPLGQDDLHLFQITTQARLTLMRQGLHRYRDYPDLLENNQEIQPGHYIWNDDYFRSKMETLLVSYHKTEPRLYENWISIIDQRTHWGRWSRFLLIEYLKSNTDLSWTQIITNPDTDEMVPCIAKTVLPNYDDYVEDEGLHLGKDGNKKIAKWVYENIQHKL